MRWSREQGKLKLEIGLKKFSCGECLYKCEIRDISFNSFKNFWRLKNICLLYDSKAHKQTFEIKFNFRVILPRISDAVNSVLPVQNKNIFPAKNISKHSVSHSQTTSVSSRANNSVYTISVVPKRILSRYAEI